jgi:hypothetical protein
VTEFRVYVRPLQVDWPKGGVYLMGKLCDQLVEGIKRKPQTSRDGNVPDKPIDGGL